MISYRNDMPVLLLLILIKGNRVQLDLDGSPQDSSNKDFLQAYTRVSVAAGRMSSFQKWCDREAGQAPFSTEHCLDLTWTITSSICENQL